MTYPSTKHGLGRRWAHRQRLCLHAPLRICSPLFCIMTVSTILHSSRRLGALAVRTGAFAVGAAAVWLLNEDRGRDAAASDAGQDSPLRQSGLLSDSHGEQHIVNWCA